MPDLAGAQRRWLGWVAAIVAAIGILLLLSRVAMGDTPVRRHAPVAAHGI
jgi:hypothetical protein